MTADPIRSFYSRRTRLYDWLARLPGVRAYRSAAVDALRLGAVDTAVDMGAGTGATLRHLRSRVGPDGRVIALDLTRAMLTRARNRGRGDADLLQADAARPPIAGPVDGVIATFVVAMFEDPAAVVDEWCDLAAPDGRVALLHFARNDDGWARPLHPLYRAFVRVGSTVESGTADPVAAHDARVRQAHRALAERATDYSERRLAAGFVRLASGRVPSR